MVAAAAPAQDALLYYEGDGVVISIDRLDEDSGRASGRLVLEGVTQRYSGAFVTEELFRGTLQRAGARVPFTARETADEDVVLELDGRTYELEEVDQPSRALPPVAGGGGRGTGGSGASTPPRAEPRRNDPPRPDTDAPPSAAPLEAQLVLSPVELRDPGMDGVVSHRLLKPKGWRLEGGAQWTPQRYKDFVHLNLRVEAEDGRAFVVYPGGLHTYIDGPLMAGAPMPQPGTVSEGVTFMPPPASVQDYVTRVVLPEHRPRARDLEVVAVTPLPEIARLMEASFGMVIDNARQGDAQAAAMGYRSETSFSFAAEKLHVRYEEAGAPFEEEIYCLGYVMTMATQMPSAPGHTTYTWSVEDLRSARAPRGKLAATRPIIEAIAASMQQDPRWSAAIRELQARINRKELAAIARRGEIMRQANEEVFARHQDSVRKASESQDRLNQKFCDMIRDVDRYSTGDGQVTLPSFYDRAFSDGQGNYLLTNDALFDPNTDATLNSSNWRTIERVR